MGQGDLDGRRHEPAQPARDLDESAGLGRQLFQPVRGRRKAVPAGGELRGFRQRENHSLDPTPHRPGREASGSRDVLAFLDSIRRRHSRIHG